MPAPIISALVQYLSGSTQLNASVWEGETPRYDALGNPNPDSITIPSSWPVFNIEMPESGMMRDETTEDPYDERGDMMLRIWATGRAQCESLLGTADGLVAGAQGWAAISAFLTGGPVTNPYRIIQILIKGWTCVQEKEIRTKKSELLYRGDLLLDVHIHGAISTF